jgi:hypothetical protein
MISFVAVLAVAAWLLLMIPAAFVLFVGNPVDTDDRATNPALAVVPRSPDDNRDERAAA